MCKWKIKCGYVMHGIDHVDQIDTINIILM